jgi:Fe-S cluster assembly protein SufD
MKSPTPLMEPTMVGTLDGTQTYLDDFKTLSARWKGEPAWLRALRESAFDSFERLGFPTADHEDWRFTNVAPIVQGGFRAVRAPIGSLVRTELQTLSLPVAECYELVFVDGHFAPDLSRPGATSPGIDILPLEEAIRRDPDGTRAHLGRFADPSQECFTALNAAFLTCGAVVHIPKGRLVEGLIHLVFVSTRGSAGTACHPRNLIVAGESCQATVLESYLGLGEAAYFTNAVTEIVAGENSVLEHYMVVRDTAKAVNVSTLRVQQARSSNFASHSVLLGGSLIRNNVHPVLDGEGCQSLLNGLYLVNGRQHMDNFMRVEHAKPHGDSRQFYKGIIDDEGHAVFSGRIIVHKDAQKTDAKQTNMNLLLSDKGQIDTKPQLEIYADDVKCTHGATIGQIDPDAVFYLRSRGLGTRAARGILIYAFANESLGRMRADGVRRSLESLLSARLPHVQPPEGES